MEVDVSINDSL